MWPSRKRNTESSWIWTWTNVFSRRSWMREGPHMRTQAERESHWWWEMVSWTVFLTAREMKKLREIVMRTGVRKQMRKSRRK